MLTRNFCLLAALGIATGIASCQKSHPTERVLMPVAVAATSDAAAVRSEASTPVEGWLPVAPQEPPVGTPVAIVDLAAPDSLALVSGEWRYSDVSVRPSPGRAVGADLRASGPANRTLDYTPKAQARDFDDSSWAVVDPRTLEQRRGHGKLSFGWYRLRVTLPATLGGVDTSGMTVAFEIAIDDYAEVWVDGVLPARLGAPGGAVVSGFNAPNRVVLTRDARPGQTYSLAIFAMNGPVSHTPDNFLWIRSATLDFHRPPVVAYSGFGRVERLNPALDAAIAPGAKIEKLANGFLFTEGPAWNFAESSLFFSDPNANTVYRYEADGLLSVFRPKSGYKGVDVGRYHQPGSNGLAFDREGRLTLNEHGNRRVTRLEKNGVLSVLADRFEGKRLNSPNDLVYRSDGALYFTDPPFGLPNTYADPGKELGFSGVFRLKDGVLTLLAKELAGPNGIAFSPDERQLYVSNWDEKAKVVFRYPVAEDGTLGAPVRFFDLTSSPGEEALDGVKVDERGNVYVSGPGGVWIVSPEGKPIGVLRMPELPANFAWGGADRKTLYMTARTGLYRIRTDVAGVVAFSH